MAGSSGAGLGAVVGGVVVRGGVVVPATLVAALLVIVPLTDVPDVVEGRVFVEVVDAGAADVADVERGTALVDAMVAEVAADKTLDADEGAFTDDGAAVATVDPAVGPPLVQPAADRRAPCRCTSPSGRRGGDGRAGSRLLRLSRCTRACGV